MDVDDLILVSVDDHVVEPPDLFDGRLPAKYADLAPQVHHQRGRHQRLALRGPDPAQRGPQRRGRPAPRGVRHRAHLLRPAPARLLRHRRAGQGHGRQRRARLAVLPLVPPVLRPALRPHRGQGRGPGHGPGLQRLAHRRVVRHPPGPVHPLPHPGHLGPRGPGRRGPAHARPRAPTPSPSRRTRPSWAGPASTPTTGTRSGRRAATRRWWSACTSARPRSW